ncbi:hypothetical protein [Aestuariivivens sediminis]|uniref:hypothetical protein n=1 Tax=Aestuariivivens sediminis TaxID=2913557 RepID=UPI001F562B29|nr:hypothetical protein [Aestuariivivens sediminis]
MKIYNNHYPEVQRRIEDYQQNLMAFFRPVMYETFAFNVNSEGNNAYKPLNIEALSENHLFINVVETAHLNFIKNYNHLIEIREGAKAVIDLLNMELNN